MGIVVKEASGLPLVPEGVYQAVCYSVWDIGTQFSEKWGKSAHQGIVVWELCECRMEVERDGVKIDLPRAVSKKYTMSLNEKASLRKDLQSWRGRNFTREELNGFDITKLLGVNCMIQIIHNQKDNKVFANIASITPLYKGLKKLDAENPLKYFSLSENVDIPEGTPKWIAELIEGSAEYQGRFPAEEGREEPPVDLDQVPF